MAAHVCEECGLIHDSVGSQESDAVKIARIEAENRLAVARLEARAVRDVAETETESELKVAKVEAEAEIVSAVSEAEIIGDSIEAGLMPQEPEQEPMPEVVEVEPEEPESLPEPEPVENHRESKGRSLGMW